jgi:hypothetical protein
MHPYVDHGAQPRERSRRWDLPPYSRETKSENDEQIQAHSNGSATGETQEGNGARQDAEITQGTKIAQGIAPVDEDMAIDEADGPNPAQGNGSGMVLLTNVESHGRNDPIHHNETDSAITDAVEQSADSVSLQQLIEITAAGATEDSYLQDLPSNHALSESSGKLEFFFFDLLDDFLLNFHRKVEKVTKKGGDIPF